MASKDKKEDEDLTPEQKRKRSKLYALKPIIDRMPAVKKPDTAVHFRYKMAWTIGILVLYFVMTNIFLYGLETSQTVDLFASYRAILAGAQGSLMHLGIGPIVTGSIIMQLFVGAKIINLNLRDEKDKAIYQGTQKLVVLIMIGVESAPQVYGFLNPSNDLIKLLGDGNARFLIFAQLYVGSYLVFLMDELISKWGIGSGISLFIAAGVSNSIFTGTFNWQMDQGVPAGLMPKSIFFLQTGNAGALSGGTFEELLFGVRYPPNTIIALMGTMAVFFVVCYTESMRIELPLAHAKARGARGRYPIKLLYASNIPVILMSAVLANISMFSLLFWQHPTLSQTWGLGHQWWFGGYPTLAEADKWGIQQTTPISGLAYYTSVPNGAREWILPLMYPQIAPRGFGGGVRPYWQIAIHVGVYMLVMVWGSKKFAQFWIETTNMGSEAVAKQIQSSKMLIPGFRRDPRIIAKVLNRYIPAVTAFSGVLVGFLAAGADLIGTIGNASGTGVLLTVGIMVQFYEAMGREQMMEMHPMLRGFFGEK